MIGTILAHLEKSGPTTAARGRRPAVRESGGKREIQGPDNDGGRPVR